MALLWYVSCFDSDCLWEAGNIRLGRPHLYPSFPSCTARHEAPPAPNHDTCKCTFFHVVLSKAVARYPNHIIKWNNRTAERVLNKGSPPLSPRFNYTINRVPLPVHDTKDALFSIPDMTSSKMILNLAKNVFTTKLSNETTLLDFAAP